mmetsp:Transcript_20122/g.29874  ORF Transcript_20122/g.29874 Transcript_20122/m.29874 type:complete len:105 (+) Transcript_20122:247-561(+)
MASVTFADQEPLAGLCARQSSSAFDERSCHKLCRKYNLTGDGVPDCTEDFNNDTDIHCEDSKFITFEHCQNRYPNQRTSERQQCLCGNLEEGEQTGVCDSEFGL